MFYTRENSSIVRTYSVGDTWGLGDWEPGFQPGRGTPYDQIIEAGRREPAPKPPRGKCPTCRTPLRDRPGDNCDHAEHWYAWGR